MSARAGDRRKEETKLYKTLYQPLIGAEIVGAFVKWDDEQFGMGGPIPVLRIKLPQTLTLPSDLRGQTVEVEVWQDPEGNGPGHLDLPWGLA